MLILFLGTQEGTIDFGGLYRKSVKIINLQELVWSGFHQFGLVSEKYKDLLILNEPIRRQDFLQSYNKHVYCPGMGAYEPLGSNFFQNH